ncbi:MAG: MauE/DoxX family redox-associated membrane protein [Paeniglutamicibacter terrestris]|nr:hypothetical protein CGQ24_11475 [Arthrobacter sp. 7749]
MIKPSGRWVHWLRTASAPTSWPRSIMRILLGIFLLAAGTSHLSIARAEFRAQVPEFVPLNADLVVLGSGIIEILLGLALLILARWRVPVGWAVALFFVAVFPGNVAQWLHGRDGFGLDTDAQRFIRLFFQPLLIILTFWSTGAWRDRKRVDEDDSTGPATGA